MDSTTTRNLVLAGLTGAAVATCLLTFWRKKKPQLVCGIFDQQVTTPLVELKTLSKELGCRVAVKCEHLQPGGSVKDRAAMALVRSVEKNGSLKEGGTIVQPTGGNTGVSLAMMCRAKGYKCIITVPANVSPDKIALLEMFGADVKVCTCVPISDERHYVNVAHAIAKETNACLPDQFENLENYLCHYNITGPEIWEQANGQVDAFVSAAGTGGTIAGVGKYLKEKGSACYLIDPTGSGLKSYVEKGKFEAFGSCFIDGIGIMRKTANFAQAKVDGAFLGTDREAIEMAYYLLRNEGLWVGPSAALNVVGAVKVARKLQLKSHQTVVAILCDGGERYLANIFNKEWQREKQLEPRATGVTLDFVLPDDN